MGITIDFLVENGFTEKRTDTSPGKRIFENDYFIVTVDLYPANNPRFFGYRKIVGASNPKTYLLIDSSDLRKHYKEATGRDL